MSGSSDFVRSVRKPSFGFGPDGRICYRLKVKDSEGNVTLLPNPLRIRTCSVVDVSLERGDERSSFPIQCAYCETRPEARWIWSEPDEREAQAEEIIKPKSFFKILLKSIADFLGLRRKKKR